jgi:hypothetical protein
MKITSIIKPTLIMSAFIFAGPIAAASSYDEKVNPKTYNEIASKLEEQGYKVRKVEKEDGHYEAYALKDGNRFELYLNQRFEIVRVKRK